MTLALVNVEGGVEKAGFATERARPRIERHFFVVRRNQEGECTIRTSYFRIAAEKPVIDLA
jgi:hypothetical protein